MFSSRVPADLRANRVSRALSKARADGRGLIDLTVTNPTVAGIAYPPSILAAMSSADAATYDPQPLGMLVAREAIAHDYARRGLAVSPNRIVLTAGTSEAYAFLFKLLCEPSGDAVLVPVPSYPLFDHLTRLEGVTAAEYALEFHGRWTVDFGSVDAAWSARTRAVLAVSPNNPTGSLLSHDEVDELSSRCAARGAALILDEVFADYPLAPSGACTANHELRTSNREPRCLTFRLGGLSKSAGLPQAKLGWMAVDGPESLVAGALDRLELLCDTYLSVSTPVQVAAPSLIAAGADVRGRIAERIRTNDVRLRELARPHNSIHVLPVEAGWSAVLRIPARTSEEATVLELIERDGVAVHPGFFFDFPHEAFLIVSLLPDTACFAEGMRRVLERVDA
jgi:alanine-synthesizing transaminase